MLWSSIRTLPSAPTSNEPNGRSPSRRPGGEFHGTAEELLVVGCHRSSWDLWWRPRAQGLPGAFGLADLGRVAVERVEHHRLGAEQPDLVDVGEDLLDGAHTGQPVRAGDLVSVIRSAMRGINAGTGRPSSSAVASSRPTPDQPSRVNRSGCQASPSSTARRMPASLLPPTQIGIARPGSRLVGQAPRMRDQVLVGQRAAPPERTPSASNSCRAQPTPTPRTSRPPLSRLRFAAIRAVSSGCRYGTMSTVVPSRTRRVTPASQASVVNGS